MKPYPAYKPTGLKWLPEVPQGWEMLHLFQVAHETCCKNVGCREMNVLSLSFGSIKRKQDIYAGLSPTDFATYQIVEPGNTILRLTDLQNDKRSLRTGLVKERGIITSAYTCVVPHGNADYLHYALHTLDLHKIYYGLGGGVRQSIGFKEIRQLQIPVPPLPEQAAIVAYLDAKTAKFDRLIKLKEREIELLQEKKQVVISTVVTRGLDPNVKLVDSGVAWLGKIPQGWKVVPFKTLFRFGKGLMITKDDLTETGESVISYGQIHSKTNSGVHLDSSLLRHVPAALTVENSRLNRGDIVFADTSEDIPGCGNCVLIDTDEKVYAGYHTLIARAAEKECSPYLAALFQSVPWRCQIWEKVNGVKVFSVTQKVFSGVTVFIPPPEEQRKIVAHLDAELMKIDRAVGAMRRQIELLREYRTRLISDAVTGRIDLREAVT